MTGECKEDRVRRSSVVACDRTRGNGHELKCKIPSEHKKRFFYCEGCWAQEEVAQRGCKVLILGVIQNSTGHSPGQPAVVDTAVSRSMELPSNLNYYMILWSSVMSQKKGEGKVCGKGCCCKSLFAFISGTKYRFFSRMSSYNNTGSKVNLEWKNQKMFLVNEDV